MTRTTDVSVDAAWDEIETITSRKKDPVAFFLGNGVNRVDGNDNASWDKLLSDVSEKYLNKSDHSIFFNDDCKMETVDQVSHTEFFDIVNQIAESQGSEPNSLKKEIRLEMEKWSVTDTHKSIVAYCSKNRIPILTTNYDLLFERALDDLIGKRRTKKIHFSYSMNSRLKKSNWYTWCDYYSDHTVVAPMTEFGIWHIHGHIQKVTSIKIGAQDYARLCKYLVDNRLVVARSNYREYHVKNTWLDMFFASNLVIVGAGLNVSETNLRWLLMYRHKNFENLKVVAKEAEPPQTFLFIDKISDAQRKFFETFGVTCVEDKQWGIYKKIVAAAERY